MSRAAFILVWLFFAFSLKAMTNQELLKNLNSRLHPLPGLKGTLIQSFSNHSQSYIYDQALAIIALTKEGDKKQARQLLKGLSSIQLPDGSLYFSYYLNGTSPYPQEGDKRIAGAMAWVALSAVHYQNKFKSKEFYSFNHKLLSYLYSEIKPITINGARMKALRFAPNDVASTIFNEQNTAALEHNLDAYSAFIHFERVNKKGAWNDGIKEMKKFIVSMWDKTNGHFWSGASYKEGAINKAELYLDNQTWSLLALDKETLKEISPGQALELNCEVFFVKDKGISGFMDSKPTRGPASEKFVWSEGTLGQVLAMKKIEKLESTRLQCNRHTSEDLLKSMDLMKTEDGGIAYSTTSTKTDFTTASSVAGTAWLYFASNDFNPFDLEELN